MSGQYHTIIFYTAHPDDKISQEIITELQGYPDLKNQIRLICVSNPNLNLPQMIVEMDTFPVIVTRGIDHPLMGEHALSWIKEGHFSGKTTADGFGDLDKAQKVDDDFGTLATESSRTSYHQAFNDDWNRDGVDQSSHMINSTFSSISETQNVDTFEEGGSKGGGQMDREMRRLQMQRDSDVPPPQRPGVGVPPHLAGGGGASHGPGTNLPPPQSPQMFDTRGGAMPPPSGFPNFQHPLANPRPPPYGGFPQSRPQSQSADFRSDPRGNFPPPPPANPMIPQHPGSMQPPPGNAFPPQVAGPIPGPSSASSGPNRNQNINEPSAGNVPMMPTGFGGGTSLNDAYGGMSLLGTGEINNQFNPRREQLMNPGLPTGRGRMGPSTHGIGTRAFQ